MTTNDYDALSIDQLLTGLEVSGRLPHLALIHALMERGAEAAPGLIEMLASEPDEDWDDDDPRWFRNVHAGVLLCALREPGALPVFERIIREYQDIDLLEWFDIDLPWYYGPLAVPMLIGIVQDVSAEDGARIFAVDKLGVIGIHHLDQRTRIIEVLRGLLPPLGEGGHPIVTPEEREEPPELWTWIVNALMDLRDRASQPRVLALFEADLIYDYVFGGAKDYLAAFEPDADPPLYAGFACDIYEDYERLHREAQEEKRRLALAVAEQERQRSAAVRRSATLREAASPLTQESDLQLYGRPAGEPIKVGRNEPCPCGSGKKYKKCCGRRQ